MTTEYAMTTDTLPQPVTRGTVEARGVSKFFTSAVGTGDRRTFVALGKMDLAVSAHEFVSIVGPSGCGKTTFLRIVAGLTKPDDGVVRVGGEQVRGPGRDRAVVFQDDALLPWLDVTSNIAFGLKLAGVPRAERTERAIALVLLVGLHGFEKAFPRQLSGGTPAGRDRARARGRSRDPPDGRAVLEASTRSHVGTCRTKPAPGSGQRAGRPRSSSLTAWTRRSFV